MAERINRRWQESVRDPDGMVGEGLRLTVTRRGIEVEGWYDSLVGLGPIKVTWADLEAMRERVKEGQPC